MVVWQLATVTVKRVVPGLILTLRFLHSEGVESAASIFIWSRESI